MRYYFLSVAAGAMSVLVVLSLAATLAERNWADRLPPPAISGVVATDEKLSYLRQRNSGDPDILAVGSSITWMHLDGAPFAAKDGDLLNGGTAFVKVHQTHRLTQFYLDLYPGVSSVVMMTSLPDFENCGSDAAIMNETDAKRYVQQQLPTGYFYLRYFVPLRYLLQARNRPAQTAPYYPFGYWMDRYGTTPTLHDVGADYDLRYDAVAVDEACLAALGRLADDLAGRGIGFTLVVTPVNPRYSAAFPATDAAVAQISGYARRAGIDVHDAHSDPRYGAADFWDAFHLQWPAAQRLSHEIAQRLSFQTADASGRGDS